MHALRTDNPYRRHIREVPDFPRPGILFYDIAPLVGNSAVFAAMIDEMAEPLRGEISKVICFDARGFIFGAAVAAKLGAGLVMLRKPGKLPGETYRQAYDLEYGTNELEVQADVIDPDEKVVLIDDIIATGGTAVAGIELVRKCGADIVEFCAAIDLPGLGGSRKIREEGIPVRTSLRLP